MRGYTDLHFSQRRDWVFIPNGNASNAAKTPTKVNIIMIPGLTPKNHSSSQECVVKDLIVILCEIVVRAFECTAKMRGLKLPEKHEVDLVGP